MSTADSLPPKQLLAMKIIAAALIAGLLTFTVIVVCLVHWNNQGRGLVAAGKLPLISIVALAMFAIQVPLSFFMPRIITRQFLQRIVDGKPLFDSKNQELQQAGLVGQLAIIRQTTMIIGYAILEGVGFLAGIAYLLEGQLWVLAVLAIVLALMIIQFPKEQSIFDWIERQVETIQQLKQQRSMQDNQWQINL